MEVNGTPSNAVIRAAVDISYDLNQPRFMEMYNKTPNKYPQWRADTKYCEKNFEKNMIKIRNTMEAKLRHAFNVKNVEINLNLVRFGDQNDPIVEISPPMEQVQQPINESFKFGLKKSEFFYSILCARVIVSARSPADPHGIPTFDF